MVDGLNPTKIDWCTHSWPVITGCDNRMDCYPYCYARTTHNRFLKDHPHYNPDFSYKFNADVLEAPIKRKAPSIIFIGSMGEWWHPYVPLRNQLAILDVVNACPQHIFICLTKQPGHMRDLMSDGYIQNPAWRCDPGDVLPENLWVGTTVTTTKDFGRLIELEDLPHSKKFLSIEPLLEDIAGHDGWEVHESIGWVILGAQTGPGAVVPDQWWVKNLLSSIPSLTPLLVKDNLRRQLPHWNMPQEFPEGFPC